MKFNYKFDKWSCSIAMLDYQRVSLFEAISQRLNGRLETQNDGGRGRAGADARWAYVIELDDGNKLTGNPFRSGVGKCPNWTSHKYWGYNFQQVLEGDVQNPQNGKFTKSFSWWSKPWRFPVDFPKCLPIHWHPLTMTFDMEYLDTCLVVHATYKVDYHPSYKML